MTVASILKQKGRVVETARSDLTLADIVGRLAEKGIGAVVVSDRPRELSGIISERDIVRAIASHGADALGSPVRRFMTASVTTCREGDTIEACMEMMTGGRFRHLPVVEDGVLVGIVSIGDVVKARIAQAEFEAEAMRSYIVAS